MRDALVRLIGWRALILQSDPLVTNRWLWLRRHLRGSALRTLDAGCGNGAFAIYAAHRGNSVVGISSSPRELGAARRRAELANVSSVTFQDADLRDLARFAGELGTFEQVLCLEVIEHLRADQRLVQELSGLLANGGRLLLTTPWKHHRPLYGERLSAEEDGGHVRWGYDRDELAALFENAGLRIESQAYLAGPLSQRITGAYWRAMRFGVPVAWVLTAPLRLLPVADIILARLGRARPLSIAVVGVKEAG